MLLNAIVLAACIAAPKSSLEIGDVAPSLAGSTWHNLRGARAPELGRTKVTLVHFWTSGCINCRNNQPIYTNLLERLAGKSFAMIGIHTPETLDETKDSTLLAYVKSADLRYPILADTDRANWKAWKQKYWPTVYVLDEKRVIRGKWIGELNWQDEDGEQQVIDLVQKLLKRKSAQKKAGPKPGLNQKA